MARFAALICVLALVAPGAALAQGGGAFDPLPPAPPEPATVPQEEQPAEDDGLSSTQQLLIAMSGFVLLFGIGGFGDTVALPFGGVGTIGGLFLGLIVVVVALGVLALVGRRRQARAQEKARAARSGGG